MNKLSTHSTSSRLILNRVEGSKIFKKLTKKVVLAILALIVIVVPLLYLTLLNSKSASASWFDENWLYRIAIPISAHTAAENNVYITVTIDTATPITASKMQSDCGDLRFTKENGELLPYFINASPGCNNASTTIQVNFDSFPAGAQTIYYYYGNPTTSNGFNSAAFSTEATSYTIGSQGSETQGPGPVAYWKFDDGQGTTAQDSTSDNNDGTLSGTTKPTWQTEDQCVSGKCLYFNGSTSYVSLADNSSLKPTNVTVSAWVRTPGVANSFIFYKYNPSSPYQGYGLALDASNNPRFWVGGNAWTAGTIAVNDNQWHYLVATYDSTNVKIYIDGVLNKTNAQTATLSYAINATIGAANSGVSDLFKGTIDEVKIYPYARTPAQVKQDYLAGKANAGTKQGTAAVLGSKPQDYLSNGLVGYWKMEEAASPSIDSSGNGLSGTWNGNTAQAAGKFGSGVTLDGTGDFVSIANNSVLNTASGTVAAWIKISSFATNRTIIAKWVNDPYGYRLVATSTQYITFDLGDGSGADSIATNSTISANTWYHVVGTWSAGAGITLYVNGARETGPTGTRTISYSGTPSTLNIGRNVSEWDLNGVIDDVRIYNRALSPKEVSDLYNWAPGPVGYWQMDDPSAGSGQVKTDTSGNGNNGTTYSANGTGMNCNATGKVGGGCSMDGTDDYIESASTFSVGPTSTFTLSGWANTNVFESAGNNQRRSIIAAKVNTNEFEAVIGLPYSTANNWSLEVGKAGVESQQTLSTSTFNLNQWYYITGVFKGGTADLYVNGVYQSSATYNATVNSATAASRGWDIGAEIYNGSIASKDFSGFLDDVKVYNYARSAKQIVSDMNAGGPAPRSLGAVGYWKFDEGADNKCSGGANDTCNSGSGGSTLDGAESGMAVPATSTSGWTQAGKFGKALNFDGSNDYITLANSTGLSPGSGNLTVSTWVNTSVLNSAEHAIYWDYGSATNNLVAFRLNSSNKFDVYFRDGSANVLNPVSTRTFSTSTWYHVVGVKSDTSAKIYINGVNEATVSNSSIGTITTSDGTVPYIGSIDGTNSMWNGSIDEVKIYNYALTADEVKTEYNRGSSLVLGAAGNNSTYQPQAANQEYCVPGDTTSCAAPVGRWDFEEGSGTSAYDTSGNAKTGTWAGTGSHWTNGNYGKGGNFNGSDDRVSTANDPYSNSQVSAGAIEAWIKTTITPANTRLIADIEGYANLNISNAGKAMGCSDGVCTFATSTTSINDGRWHHLAVTWSGTSYTRIFVDGKQESSTTPTSAPTPDSVTRPFRIGDHAAGGAFFTGQIDGVRVFNYARSAAQIAWDYNRGKPVGWWKLDECQGSVAHDSADLAAGGSGNNGTITMGSLGSQASLGTCAASAATAWYNGATGKRNASLNFDGTDDYVSLSSGESTFDFTNNFTVSTWVKLTQWPSSTNSYRTISKRTAAAGWSVGFWNNSGTNNLILTTHGVKDYAVSTTMAVGSWHNVTYVMNSSNAVTFYVDGIAAGTVTNASGANLNNQNLVLAALGDGTQYFNGQIDDVQIFNYALTAAQVKNEYNGGAINFGPSTGSP